MSPFADSDLIIRNPQGLNRTHVLSLQISIFLVISENDFSQSENLDMDRLPPGCPHSCQSFHFLGFCKVVTWISWIIIKALMDQRFKCKSNVFLPGLTVYAYWVSMPLNGSSPTLLPFLPEDSLQEFTQPMDPKRASTFWSRATARYWWWRTGDSWTRFGRSETSSHI